MFIPLLFAISAALLVVKSKFPDGDTFFIISAGRYIVENGIVPTVNPFVIHDGFGIIVQQWLFDVLIYQIYNFGGNFGLFLYSGAILFVTLFMLYQYFGFYSDNKQLKLLVLAFWALIVSYFVIARPTSVSFLLCLSVVMVMESYRRKRKHGLLLLLPVLSLVTINMHAAMWPMLFVLMVPFIFPDRLPKKKQFGMYIKSWFGKWKWVLLAMGGMLLAGFINPNGIRGMGYLLLSYDSASSVNVISELEVPEVTSLPGLLILATLLLLFKYVDKNRGKMDFANFYMAAGTLVMAMMHYRNFWFLIIGMMPLFFCFFNGLKWKTGKEYKSALVYGVLNLCYLCIVVALVVLPFGFGTIEVEDDNMTPVKAVAYLDELDKEEIVLFTEFNNGAYLEFNGYQVYMDARPELFQKKINGQEDVYSEYLSVYFGVVDFEAFIDKYQFTHLIVDDGSIFSGFLRAYDGCELVVDGDGYRLFEINR